MKLIVKKKLCLKKLNIKKADIQVSKPKKWFSTTATEQEYQFFV
jgi:hypothetical protein